MKKQILLFSAALLIFAAAAFTAFAQKGKEEKGKGNQKEQPKDQKQDKGNKGKDNKSDKDNPGKGSDDKNGKGNDKSDRKDDKDNKGNKNEDKGRRDERLDKVITATGYKWDNETFRDRDKLRKGQEKVTICHKPNRENEPGVTLSVSSASLKAHLNHGDVEGECTRVDNPRFSDHFLSRRTDYFTTLQNSQEQVIYSRSILDYAVERLTGARAQLVTMERSNVPATDLERRRLLVVDLEKDVSLLEQVLGVTANLVANRLMN